VSRRYGRLTTSVSNESRCNVVGIQMLPEFIRCRIFGGFKNDCISEKALTEIERHLAKHGLQGQKITFRDVDQFELPTLYGDSIDDHFRVIAGQQIKPYKELADIIANSSLPLRPKRWILKPGWTKYDSKNKLCYSVDFPQEKVVLFDVEVLMSEGNYPTLATAVSPNAWYSWCSRRLFSKDAKDKIYLDIDDLIPLHSRIQDSASDSVRDLEARLVIGHNVGFDRSFVREQYLIKNTKTRFIDTMSLHIAVSGLTGLQRVLYMANKTGSKRKEVQEHEVETVKHGFIPGFEWTEESSLNNLSDVHQLYCKDAIPLQKHVRDIFVSGTMDDVRSNIQDLMAYCATDVKATHDVFKHLWQEFGVRFPHPVTFAGMLEMGLTYLPVTENWQKYIDSSNEKYSEMENELNAVLFQLAEEAAKLPPDSYRNNVWLWDLDWSTKRMRVSIKASSSSNSIDDAKANDSKRKSNDQSTNLVSSAAKQKFMYVSCPKWFAELCDREENFRPTKLSLQRRVAAKLLQLVWDGFPLHYDETHGWGYLVPSQQHDLLDEAISNGESCNDDQSAPASFPINSLVKLCAETKPEWITELASVAETEKRMDEILEKIQNSNGAEEDTSYYWNELERLKGYSSNRKSKKLDLAGEGPFLDVVPGCEFYKLPHRDGAGKRVGNPLAKDFLSKIEEGVLRSTVGDKAESVLKFGSMCSYWKNNVKRISSQMVVQLPDENPLLESPGGFLGAIVPRVITAGTVTRRAVEQTWLTASNAYTDRVGSELKAMIQSPPKYHFVGADVDSQELWIAAILGDANFHKIHGCTAFGWMTLQGTKSEGTDLHSHTARLAGISRDHAKVFNYGRIYGAGQRFAEQLLMKFNHRLSQSEAHKKARAIFVATKGRRVRVKNSGDEDTDEDGNEFITYRMARWD
jgi:DNA polymerase gamma 1